ncbi:SPOR domain-containing protein, partial [Methylopila sp. Yamaguchi]|uniref:SPOR domain-containing protein n=1 Tax=Methylopila sp. Yamaguchi TaxID=1437817 RepID=UPI0011AFA7EB
AQVPAAAPRPSASGGFVVQVTSQRSEAEARAAYAALQRKFPGVLGQYGANIQSANVGDRGTYYRVRVGPFADGGQASTVCNNLRSAGGDCVVSRN